jgi:hypothetical protein
MSLESQNPNGKQQIMLFFPPGLYLWDSRSELGDRALLKTVAIRLDVPFDTQGSDNE